MSIQTANYMLLGSALDTFTLLFSKGVVKATAIPTRQGTIELLNKGLAMPCPEDKDAYQLTPIGRALAFLYHARKPRDPRKGWQELNHFLNWWQNDTLLAALENPIEPEPTDPAFKEYMAFVWWASTVSFIKKHHDIPDSVWDQLCQLPEKFLSRIVH